MNADYYNQYPVFLKPRRRGCTFESYRRLAQQIIDHPQDKHYVTSNEGGSKIEDRLLQWFELLIIAKHLSNNKYELIFIN